MDRVANGDGSQMNTGTMTKFADLSEAWFAGAEPAKAGSRIEYRTATGRVIAPGITLCDDSIVVRGDGTVEFRRRGDLGEREDFPPGYWTSACDPSQVERLWEKLGDLGPDSFPARVADPGDTVAFLTGYVAGRVHTLTIGPSDATPAPPRGRVKRGGFPERRPEPCWSRSKLQSLLELWPTAVQPSPLHPKPR